MTPDLRPLPRVTVRGMSTISEPCPECEGSGKVLCENCEGKGTVMVPYFGATVIIDSVEPCGECVGGRVDCPRCSGTGEIETEDCKERDE